MIKVWLAEEPDVPLEALQSATLPLMDASELQRWQSQRLAKGQFTFLWTRYVLRQVLSIDWPSVEPAQWRFARRDTGKPYVVSENPAATTTAPAFSLSHCDGMLAIAVTDSAGLEVGVDIEWVYRAIDPMPLAQRYFLAGEQQHLLSLPEAQRRAHFLTLWTLKEACVKASGEGLSRGLRRYEFRLPPRAASGISCPDVTFHGGAADAGVWQLYSVRRQDLLIGMAALGANGTLFEEPRITVFDGPFG